MIAPGAPAEAPWRIEPTDLDLTQDEKVLAFHIHVGRYGGYSTIYSDPQRRYPSQRQMKTLASLGVVTFIDAREGGWPRGTWAARLTCVGANVAARQDGQVRLNEAGEKDLNAPAATATILDGHPGCPGGWRPDGTCTDCRRLRPLDLAAYRAYLDSLDPRALDAQVNGPQLYCIEHGYLRTQHITTSKTCQIRRPQMSVTDMHDGGLFRV